MEFSREGDELWKKIEYFHDHDHAMKSSIGFVFWCGIQAIWWVSVLLWTVSSHDKSIKDQAQQIQQLRHAVEQYAINTGVR